MALQFLKDLFVIESEDMDEIETEQKQVAEVKEQPKVEKKSKVTAVDFSEKTKRSRRPKIEAREHREVSEPVLKQGGHVDMSKINTKVCLFEPYVFGETQDIADQLKNNQTALVNLSKLDKVSKKRIIDFLSGTVYALEGDIQKVGADIFLCTPNSVGVEGVISEKNDSDLM